MAESVVRVVVSNLIQLLEGEAKLLRGVHKEAEYMKDELEIIQCFLKNADKMAEMNDGVEIWVKQVRRVAYKIEDVVDEYVLHLAKQLYRRGFSSFFRKISKAKPRHQIASEIQDIRASVNEIRARAERYGFNFVEQGSSSSTSNNQWHDPRMASLFMDDDEVVGIESTRDDLISRLVMEKSERAMVLLVGMGGLGKTTLAKKVYDNQTVIGHFDCRAWIRVSQSYKTEDLLKKMMNELHESRREILPEGIDTMEEISLINKLREYLQDKRYVIIFDDVWNIEFWHYIKSSVPNNKKGSRIIITTRVHDVASSCLESPVDHVHIVRPLPEGKAWELFCKKTFQYDFGGLCPPELEKCSLDILRRCEGLPLAIVTIGGLLSTKNKVLSEWQIFNQSLGSELGRNSHLSNVSKIILFSYHDLPYYLKSCFLYMGMIPKDYSISYKRLAHLWIAEGFVEGRSGKSLEEIGEEYIIDLTRRNLIPGSSFGVSGTITTCRVHDMVRERIILKCRELSFCQILTKENISFDAETRRLAFQGGIDYVGETLTNSRIRSLLIFRANDKLSMSSLHKLIACFKLLKVLDLENNSIDELPEKVRNLFHLRYLSVRNTKIKIIPNSIGKLQNLQTLDLINSLVRELPFDLSRLRNLRHLQGFCYDGNQESEVEFDRGIKIQKGIGGLKELQELHDVTMANHDGISLVRELENLTQLKILGITNLKKESGRALCAAIGKMVHLRALGLRSTGEDEILDIQSSSPPPQSLEELRLYGRLEKLPEWIPQLQNLVSLELGWSGLEDDPIKALGTLRNLVTLTLSRGFDGERLYFEAGVFSKLGQLILTDLKGLKLLTIEEGALPLLEDLAIGPCPQLKEVPSGISHLNKLTKLRLYDMNEKFLHIVESNKGKNDHWIVNLVPRITLYFKVRGRYKMAYKLGQRP